MSESRFRGVFKRGNRYKAQIQVKTVNIYLGTFQNENEAALAYDNRAKQENSASTSSSEAQYLLNFDDSGHEIMYPSRRRRLGLGQYKITRNAVGTDEWTEKQEGEEEGDLRSSTSSATSTSSSGN